MCGKLRALRAPPQKRPIRRNTQIDNFKAWQMRTLLPTCSPESQVLGPAQFFTDDLIIYSCLSVCLFVCLSVCPSVWLSSVCPTLCTYIYIYTHVCCLFVCLFVGLSVCLSFCLLFLYIYIYICIYIYGRGLPSPPHPAPSLHPLLLPPPPASLPPLRLPYLWKTHRDGDRSLQLLFFNEEFLVSTSHQLVLVTSLPFVHTARRSYRLSVPVNNSDCSSIHFLGTAAESLVNLIT